MQTTIHANADKMRTVKNLSKLIVVFDCFWRETEREEILSKDFHRPIGEYR